MNKGEILFVAVTLVLALVGVGICVLMFDREAAAFMQDCLKAFPYFNQAQCDVLRRAGG